MSDPMTAPNLPLTGEDLDRIDGFIWDGNTSIWAWVRELHTQSRTALDLAAQVAQARRETLKEVADTLIATAQVYREQGDAKTARVLEIVAQLYPDALATPEAGNE